MLPPATIASMNDASAGSLVFLTPTFSTASLISAGLYAFKLKIGGCDAGAGSSILHSCAHAPANDGRRRITSAKSQAAEGCTPNRHCRPPEDQRSARQ